ncbi:MAG: aspartate-semialdehyde dehydrogenase [Dehalococcoidales bacterium]
MRQFNVAVIGAQTLVGQEFIKLLDERAFPVTSVRLFSSDHYAGKTLFVKHQEVAVREIAPDSFRDIDIAFFSAGPEVSRYFAPLAVRNRALVIDTSSTFRNDKDVPMVVPEINLEDSRLHQGIISTPNCSTIQLAVILYPLHKINPIKRIIVDTYQSVSGKDSPAIEELNNQVKQVLDGQTAVTRVFSHQIAFNLLPEVDVFLDSGETREERKILEETRKIMRSPEMAISATCVWTPVFIGHSQAVHIEFTHPMPPDEARQILSAAPGVRLLDDTTVSLYPQPWSVAGTNECYVGRVRQDTSHRNGLAMWTVADNIRKGAALNAVQIAEEMIKREWLSPRG